MKGEIVIDKFFEFILFFFNFGFIAPLIILGIHFINKKIFINATLIALLSAFINTFLKNLWRVPLHHSVKSETWSFPSGHTQFNVTLWLAILFYTRKPWLAVIVVMIHMLDFLGMIHFNYHNWWDIIAGIFFAIIVFLIIPIWERYCGNRQLEFSIFCLILSLLFFVQLPYKTNNYQWLYTYFGLQIGLTIYLTLCKLRLDFIKSNPLMASFLKLTLLLGSLFLISRLHFSDLFNCNKETANFIEGIILSISTLIVIPFVFYSVHRYFNKQDLVL